MLARFIFISSFPILHLEKLRHPDVKECAGRYMAVWVELGSELRQSKSMFLTVFFHKGRLSLLLFLLSDRRLQCEGNFGNFQKL